MTKLNIILIAVLAIGGIVAAVKWKEMNFGVKSLTVLAVIGAIVTGIVEWKKYKKETLLERIAAKYGELTDDKDATYPEIQIGNSGAYFVLRGTGAFNFPEFPNMFKLYVKKNKIYFTSVIWDKTGKPLAAIEDNVWTLYTDDYEYNNDDQALEIVTKGDRKVYFQIELINGIARIAGVLYTREGRGMHFSGEPGEGGSIVIINDPETFEMPNLPKIFRYPREGFYGVRAK